MERQNQQPATPASSTEGSAFPEHLPRGSAQLQNSLLRVLPQLLSERYADESLPAEALRYQKVLARSLAALIAHFATSAFQGEVEQARRAGGISRKSFCSFYGNNGCDRALALLEHWRLLEVAHDKTRVQHFGVYRLNEKWFQLTPMGRALLEACRQALVQNSSS